MSRRVCLISLALLIGVTAVAAADRFPPAPDDLIDLDLIDLDLNAIIAEGENLWSFSFTAGYGESDLGDSRAKGAAIATLQGMFEAVNEQIGQVADIGWSGDGFSDSKAAFNWMASGRYKLPEAIRFPSIGGHFGIEMNASRVGSSILLTENGFGSSITDEVYSIGGNGLYYFPKNMTSFDIPYIPDLPITGSRRDLFLSFGGGFARGKHITELFMPPRDFSSIPPPILLEAHETRPTWQVSLGGEEFYTPYLSFSWRAGYQNMEFDELKYSDGSLATLHEYESRTPAEPIVLGYGEVATVWTPWFPADALLGSWGANPDDPVNIDFTGFTFSAGLRYHF